MSWSSSLHYATPCPRHKKASDDRSIIRKIPPLELIKQSSYAHPQQEVDSLPEFRGNHAKMAHRHQNFVKETPLPGAKYHKICHPALIPPTNKMHTYPTKTKVDLLNTT